MKRLRTSIPRLGVAQAATAVIALVLAVWGRLAKPPCRSGYVDLDVGRFFIAVQVVFTLAALGCLVVSLRKPAQRRHETALVSVLIFSLGLEFLAVIGWGSSVYRDLTSSYGNCFTF